MLDVVKQIAWQLFFRKPRISLQGMQWTSLTNLQCLSQGEDGGKNADHGVCCVLIVEEGREGYRWRLYIVCDYVKLIAMT